jgi:hypothetical protein
MIFLQANPFREQVEGLGPENRDFLGPEMAMSEASVIWAQKSGDFKGPPFLMAWVMDLPASKSLSPNAIWKACKF